MSFFQFASAAFLLRGAALVVCLAAGSGCRGAAAPAGPIEIRVDPSAANGPAAIEVINLPDEAAKRLAARELTREQWVEILRVSVGEGQPAMVGAYTLAGRTLRFAPMFPLDPGRPYSVAFNPGAIPGGAVGAGDAVSATVGLPAVASEPTTVVARLFPSSDVVPENQLRLYIHFSAPMGRKGGLDYVRLFDDRGREVVDPFLPLDAEFWNDDRTRYTVFFDPGRQKRGILPNQQMGRSLEPGRRYTLVVRSDWRDGNGLPLKTEFRREFRVGVADERPIDPQAWDIQSPPAGVRQPLLITFPEALDHGLLLRALGVTDADGKFLAGDVKIDNAETRWSFSPREPWRAGHYRLVALDILEDLAGNRVGRAFEVDRFDRADVTSEPERTIIPIIVS